MLTVLLRAVTKQQHSHTQAIAHESASTVIASIRSRTHNQPASSHAHAKNITANVWSVSIQTRCKRAAIAVAVAIARARASLAAARWAPGAIYAKAVVSVTADAAPQQLHCSNHICAL